jgi:hypothetical protein
MYPSAIPSKEAYLEDSSTDSVLDISSTLDNVSDRLLAQPNLGERSTANVYTHRYLMGSVSESQHTTPGQATYNNQHCGVKERIQHTTL